MKNRVLKGLMIMCLLLLTVPVACNTSAQVTTMTTATNSSPVTSSPLVVTIDYFDSPQIETTMFENTVRGLVENISDEPLTASIKVIFFSSDEPICDKTVNLGRIEPGQALRFTATCFSFIVGADSYTYEVVIE